MSSSKCAKCSKSDQDTSFQRCSRCKTTIYCSQDCQKADWKLHKTRCSPPLPEGTVRGIIMRCEGDPGFFDEVDLGPDHPIHTQGIVCPVSAQVGLPIVIYRHLKENPLDMRRDPELDNQRATYLMIDPESGFAPPEWQMCVGSVTVMRKDGKPLTRQSIETIWMYHDRLLDMFGDTGAPPRRMMTSDGFKRFCASYKDERLLNSHPDFANMPIPL
ncbi:MYND-type domain-containing protein [Favolaschia claudopus]|uniref:MYND-type domain-containing protein n=1 Tax=Favolaschia claudopus TaxID=2862362 RepID=A0AAW0CMP3_9AGAR